MISTNCITGSVLTPRNIGNIENKREGTSRTEGQLDVKGYSERIQPISIKNCKGECLNFWVNYGNKFLRVLKQSEYNLTSPKTKLWVERVHIPQYALTDD